MTDEIPKVFFRKPEKEKFEFEVLTFKRLFTRNVKLVCPLDQPQRVDFYHIMYFTKGHGRHFIDFKAYEYSPGSLLFISKGQIHSFEINPDTDGFIVIFTEDFLTKNMIHSDILSFSRLFNYHLYPPDISPIKTSESIFSPIMKEIHNEYVFKDTFAKEEMLRTLLKLLMLKAERVKRTFTGGEKNSEWILKFSEFNKLLLENHTATRNAEDYALKMEISYNHLNKIIKAVTGNTAKAFIDVFIIMECKRQLAVSDISVKELAYFIGFDEPTNFVKYFKKHTNLSPSQFRKTFTK